MAGTESCRPESNIGQSQLSHYNKIHRGGTKTPQTQLLKPIRKHGGSPAGTSSKPSETRATGRTIESTYNLYRRSSTKLLKYAEDGVLNKLHLTDETDSNMNHVTSHSTLNLEVKSPILHPSRAAFDDSTVSKCNSVTNLGNSKQF